MNLKKFVTGFVAAMLVGTTAFAAEKSEWMPDFNINAKWASRYMTKGKVVNPESMSFYDFSMSLKGFYAGVWIANDHNDYNESSKMQYEPEEIDYYFGYGYTFEELPVIDSLSLSATYTYFDYPSRSGWQCVGSQQHEISVAANLGVFLNPGVKINWDPELEQWYGNLNVGYDYNFKDQGCEKLTASTGFELWWGNNKYMGRPHDKHDNDIALATFCWNVSLDYAINDYITVGPFGTLSWAIDPAYRDSWKDRGSANNASGLDTLWGVRMNIAF